MERFNLAPKWNKRWIKQHWTRNKNIKKPRFESRLWSKINAENVAKRKRIERKIRRIRKN